MAIKLNLWVNPESNQTVIYVNNLVALPGKVWLAGVDGRTHVRFNSDAPKLPVEHVLEVVSVAAACDAGNWDALLSAVRMRQSKSGEKRGRARSSDERAWSRRTQNPEYRPHEWTARDAEELDPKTFAHPLTVETTLFVDDQEPAEIVDILRGIDKLRVVVKKLETGDYVVEGKLIVERKTAHDLITSVTEEAKRLFTQTNRIVADNVRGVLLVEGDLYKETASPLNNQAGILSYLAVIQGVSVIPTLSKRHTAYMIAKMVRHAVEGLGYNLDLRGAGPKEPRDAASFVLEGIPGVSVIIARALLSHFGSVSLVAGATEKELRAVQGVGPTKAKLISETLNTKFPKGEVIDLSPMEPVSGLIE